MGPVLFLVLLIGVTVALLIGTALFGQWLRDRGDYHPRLFGYLLFPVFALCMFVWCMALGEVGIDVFDLLDRLP